MTVQNLKASLHESIENIDDVDFLNSIKRIIERKYTSFDRNKITARQLKYLDKSEKEINEGSCYSNNQVNELTEKWLKK